MFLAACTASAEIQNHSFAEASGVGKSNKLPMFHQKDHNV